jgi:disulfide bond formation protein DsbB
MKKNKMPRLDQKSDSNWTILFICWLIVSISTLGSLFFSEILEYPPCILCWYQRICLFPLVVIILAGLFPLDKSVVKFALPLALAGWFIALFHNLLYAGIIPESLQPCSQGVSCKDINLDLFGFVTIPLLSLMAFSSIVVLLIILKRRSSE